MRTTNHVHHVHLIATKRAAALKAVRSFFDSQDFIEIDSPIVIDCNSPEPFIDPLFTNTTDHLGHVSTRQLHTSPELYMKRMVSHGVERCYFLGHVFRDGEGGKRHGSEFTMIEWYRRGGDLNDLIADCEQLFAAVARAVGAAQPAMPYERAELSALWREFAHIDLERVLAQVAAGDAGSLQRELEQRGALLRNGADFSDAFYQVMVDHIEPKIGNERPTVVTRWPAQMAQLAKLCTDNHLLAERFEIYAGGLELANAFYELTDARLQAERFDADNDERRRLCKPTFSGYEDFLADLPHMGDCAGIAVGFDRVLMYLLGAKDISEVMPIRWPLCHAG